MTKKEKIVNILLGHDRSGMYNPWGEVADKILALDEGLSEVEILEVIDDKIPFSVFDLNILPEKCSTRLKRALAKELSGRIAKVSHKPYSSPDKVESEPVCSCTIDNGILRNKDCSRHGKEKPKKLEYVKDPFDNEELAHKIDDIINVINKINERINKGG